MRKMKLVKAMACFMAATMAITCVPSANVVNGVSLVAEAAEGNVIIEKSTGTNSVITPVSTTNNKDGFWESFSPSYRLTGDFKVKFDVQLADTEITQNYFAPYFVFTNDVDRHGTGYLEYVVLRSDAFGWGSAYSTAQFNCSWFGPEDAWTPFRKFMQNAKITYTISRVGNDFIINGLIHGSDGKDYTYDVTFTVTDAPETIRFFFTAEGVGNNVTINSFTNPADYEKTQSELPNGVKLNEGVYEILATATTKDGKLVAEPVSGQENLYTVSLPAIFVPSDAGTQTAELGKVTTAAITVGGNTQEFDIKVLKENKCKNIINMTPQTSETNRKKVGVNNSFDIEFTLVGEDEKETVTEPVIVSSNSSNTIIEKDEEKSKGNTYMYSITPTKATSTGAISVSCGESQPITVYYDAIDNKCINLQSNTGDVINTITGRKTSIVLTATGNDPEVELSDKIDDKLYEVVKVSDKDEEIISSISYTTSAAISNGQKPLNQDSLVFTFEAPSGETTLLFKCGEATHKVVVKGNATSTSTTTPSNPTTPSEPTTPSDPATPGAVDTDPTTPEEPSTPSEPTTPSDPATPEEPTTPEEPNTTTTKKKVAKLSSVKATKGKKAVSGKVTIKATGKNVKKATIKVYVNGKKNVTTTTKATGKFSVKVSKKLKKGDKVKVVATKTTIKKVTKTVTVK